jgi:hypothetical protein
MENKFEDFLHDWFAEIGDYHGTDDDMPEAFEAWLECLQQDTVIELADVAIRRAEIRGLERARDLAVKALEAVGK